MGDVTLPLRVIVCAKQVLDPEVPRGAIRVDREAKRVVPAPGIGSVINGFDEQAIEAALRLKDAYGAKVIVVSMGREFDLNTMRVPLLRGADELVLLKDEAFGGATDSYFVASVLVAAIRKLKDFDLIICGRQASDWDNAQAPLGIAELLRLPVITMGKQVDVKEGEVVVERILPDGNEVVAAPLPAVVTVSGELGNLRLPAGVRMLAGSRKRPTTWSRNDLDLLDIRHRSMTLVDLFIRESGKHCEFIEGKDEAEMGRRLAVRIHAGKVI